MIYRNVWIMDNDRSFIKNCNIMIYFILKICFSKSKKNQGFISIIFIIKILDFLT